MYNLNVDPECTGIVMHLFIMLLYSLDMARVQGDKGATRHLPRITLNSRGEGDITGRELKEHGQRSSLYHPRRVLRDLPFPKKWTCEQSTCTLWVLELGRLATSRGVAYPVSL